MPDQTPFLAVSVAFGGVSCVVGVGGVGGVGVNVELGRKNRQCQAPEAEVQFC